MNEDGLATQPQQAQPAISIDDVIMMLKQGATPQELIDMGIPVSVIEQAIVTLQKELQQGQNQNTVGMQPMGGQGQGMRQGGPTPQQQPQLGLAEGMM